MDRVIINIRESILNAIEKLQNNKKRCLICVNDEETVAGVITDGDIRRGFLHGYTLQDSVQAILNTDFEYLLTTSQFDYICEKFKCDKIDFLPIVDHDLKLKNVITKKQFHIMLLENIDLDLSSDFTNLDHYTLEHEIYNRPWGFYKSTILTVHAQSKIITVFPQNALSLQEHKRREEHWVIIKGRGKVILGESVIDVYPGKYIYIPKGCKHQLINDSNENVIFSEVQLGEYFGEDDIIRYSDKYGRK
ncbi:MAG: cupin domain-containing protein [Erysipelotrichia bacterium]|nr:cupin domain-containing protein [Erysipelotrichia bacterium]